MQGHSCPVQPVLLDMLLWSLIKLCSSMFVACDLAMYAFIGYGLRCVISRSLSLQSYPGCQALATCLGTEIAKLMLSMLPPLVMFGPSL